MNTLFFHQQTRVPSLSKLAYEAFLAKLRNDMLNIISVAKNPFAADNNAQFIAQLKMEMSKVRLIADSHENIPTEVMHNFQEDLEATFKEALLASYDLEEIQESIERLSEINLLSTSYHEVGVLTAMQQNEIDEPLKQLSGIVFDEELSAMELGDKLSRIFQTQTLTPQNNF